MVYRLYKLQAYPVGMYLLGGRTYWLSAVVNSGGSLNGRTLFAYNDTTCRPKGVACRTTPKIKARITNKINTLGTGPEPIVDVTQPV